MSSDSTDPRDIIPPPPKSLCVSEKGKGRNYSVTSRVSDVIGEKLFKSNT